MKKNLLTTFLTALLAFIGTSSVMAGDITATLVHTAGTQWGSNTGANTVDSEKEHYNNDAATGWAGAAYAEFSFSIPNGESITSAKLTYSVKQGGSKARTDIIYYMAKDFTLDYSAIPTLTGDLRYTPNRAGKAVASASTGGTGDRIGLSQDVTDAVKAIYSAGQNYIIFQWTGNAAGSDLYGKASTNAPVLTITTVGAESQTKYTITFTDGTNELKAPVVYDGTIGNEATASATDMASFFNTDSSKKFIYQNGNKTITLVKDSASNIIPLTFYEASKVNYTVNAADEAGNTLAKIASGTNFEKETVKVAYPQFIQVGDSLLSTTANNKEFNYNVALEAGSDNTKSITYKSPAVNHIVYYSEAEDIAGMTTTTDGNANIRCSSSKGAYNAGTTEIKATTLPAGIYKIFAQVWGNTGTNFTIKAGNVDSLVVATVGYLTNGTKDITLTKSTDITIPTAGSSTKCFDLIYIQKTGDYVVPTDTVKININDSTAWSMSSSTSTDGDITSNKIINNKNLNVTITPNNSGTTNRIWNNSGKPQLRVYGGKIILEGAAGKAIKSVTLGNSKWNASNTFNGVAATTGTWTGNSTNVLLGIAGNTQINSITVLLQPTDENTTTYEEPRIPLTVVDSIGQFVALTAKTEARLNLNHKKNAVVFANDNYVVIQDESKARMVLYKMGLNVKSNDILTGSIAGKFSPYYGTNEMTVGDSTDVTTVTATAGSAIVADGLASVKAAKDAAKILKLCALSDVKLYTYNSKRFVKDAAGDTIEIKDNFGVGYVLPADTALKSITGIVYIYAANNDTTYRLAPISTDGWTIAVPQYYKAFTAEEVFLPTAENVTAGQAEGSAWIEGGATRVDNKSLTLDPTTETEATTKSAPGVGIKMGNSAKSFTTYITGVKILKAFGTSTSSTANRCLVVTATPTEGDAVTANGVSVTAKTVMVTLTLDPSKKYKVTYEGTNETKDAGGDVALHAIKFSTSDIATAISDLKAIHTTDGAIYNLNGQKVRNAGETLTGLKGLYIINGTKTVIK